MDNSTAQFIIGTTSVMRHGGGFLEETTSSCTTTLFCESSTTLNEMSFSGVAREFADDLTLAQVGDSSWQLQYSEQVHMVIVQSISDSHAVTDSTLILDPLTNTVGFSELETDARLTSMGYRVSQRILDETLSTLSSITTGLSASERIVVVAADAVESRSGTDSFVVAVGKYDFVLMMVCVYRGWNFIVADQPDGSRTSSVTGSQGGAQLSLFLI